jgi:hypothetical protein
MTTLEIPIPDELYEALAERAQRNERSVEEQILADLDIVEENRRRRRRALDRLRELPPIKSSLDPVKLIREDRDR